MRLTITLSDGSNAVLEDDDPEALGAALAAFERLRVRRRAIVQTGGNPWETFIERLRDKPKLLNILRAVKNSGSEGIERHQLVEVLQLRDTLELGGQVGSIRRTTLRSGFETVNDVITLRDSRYRPAKALQENALPN